jgi:hypothetical protein
MDIGNATKKSHVYRGMQMHESKIGLVIPTHWSKKGFKNGKWGPPTTGWLDKTIESLYARCPDAKSIPTTIVCNTRCLSDLYSQNLGDYCQRRGYTLRLDSSAGFRDVRLGMCEWFQHDYLFLVEHDWEFMLDIPLKEIVEDFDNHDHINYVRFNKRPNVPKEVLTATKRVGGDLYLIRDKHTKTHLLHTPQYSNNPHIERMSKYREWCEYVKANPVFAGKNGGAGGFEHPLQEKSLDDLNKYGIEKRNEMWGTYIYGYTGMKTTAVHFGI